MNTNGQTESVPTASTAPTRSTFHEIGARIGDLKDDVGDRGSALITNVGRMIKHRPFAAVGIAMGIGALAMVLLRRR